MKRKATEDVSPKEAKMLKMTVSTNPSLMIDEEPMQFIVFSYVHPDTYMNLLLSCKRFQTLLKANDCFRYARLYCNFDYSFIRDCPPIGFMRSSSAKNLQSLLFHKRRCTNFSYNPIEYEDLVDLDEETCLELLKLFCYSRSSMEMFPWFQQIADKLELIKQAYKKVKEEEEEEPSSRDLVPMLLENKDILCNVLYENYVNKYIRTLAGDDCSREVSLMVVESHGRSLKHLSQEMKKDREVALRAIQSDEDAIYYVATELKQDRSFMLAAASINGAIMKHLTDYDWIDDREVVMEAVKSRGDVLEFLPKEYKSDVEIVMAAVKQSGRALKFASKRLQGSRHVVIAAMKQNKRSLEYATKKLQKEFKDY